ncbi:uncharacterized protein PITG_19513 [Phytophthora infestans T30-4]|uniref:Uncharacterized protein n=1 Tax=Phytophthora infestans (strain T30-4) TaxID=403677 RepID=D0P0Z4_PHYIT|nr:uncharacterized protein PITG_19513 [Phytophthora infestans T30-4]EEY53704.1 conserved hypothetical protein [Phytophthora infestans T30-4]|eukprot:XP_002896027.1 conserved hypothetical protein [Phytophthora infestans T30-4]
MAESFTVQDHFVELGYTIDDSTKGPISHQCRGCGKKYRLIDIFRKKKNKPQQVEGEEALQGVQGQENVEGQGAL